MKKLLFLFSTFILFTVCYAQNETIVSIRNNTGSTIVIDMPNHGIHSETLKPKDLKGPYRFGLIMKGEEGFCIKKEGAIKWTQCFSGDDPKKTSFLPVGSYIMDINFSTSKNIWVIRFTRVG